MVEEFNSTATHRSATIPPLLQFWLSISNAVPSIYLPGTRFDIAFTLLSVWFLLSVRSLFDSFFQGYLGWDPNNKLTTDCAASATSILHSLILCPGLAYALYSSPPFLPTAKMTDAPKWWQEIAVAQFQFCTGYMLYDTIGLVMDNKWNWIHPDDINYLVHHVITVIMMSQCRVLGAGHKCSMSLMMTGEFTNPMMNINIIMRYAIKMEPDGSIWHLMHPYSELIYAVFYAFFRLVVGPLQIIHITYHLLFTKLGRERIPLSTALVWTVVISAIILGSLPYSFEAIDMIKDGLAVKYDQHFDYGPRYEL